MNRNRFILGFVFLFFCLSFSFAQTSKRVLFVGNSYTEVNNLPQMVSQIAQSMGDNLAVTANTPGGCTYMQHCTNQSMTLICQGGWDAVVLQEQSQYPSFPQAQVEAEVFPYAQRLVDSIYAHNPCAEPMFYMTWGRKNGDAANAVYFPVLGTYEGMDSMLCLRYTYMATANDASLCPVGRVWRYLRTHHSSIELYQSDGSHPSLAGTYAAACAFYVMLFHQDPTHITYDSGLDSNTAQIIRDAVRTVVYEHMTDWQRPEPQAAFDIENTDNQTVTLTNNSTHASELAWDFGDGETLVSSDSIITHTYADSGQYTITLNASRHCMSSTATALITIPQETGIENWENTKGSLLLFPNPAQNTVTIYADGEVFIYNITGQLIKTTGMIQECTTLDISDFPCGIYIIKSQGESAKLIVR